jgi:hypothetical protein
VKYTFIIGCARSGTSILGELIASHPEVKYIFEASHIWELGGLGENESHRLTAQAATPQVKEQIRAWFEIQAGDANIVVEKNPRNSLRVPYVKEIFPEAKFIHIVRDGRDVACSLVPGCGGPEWNHLKPPSWKEYYVNYSGAIRCAHVWKEVVETTLSDLPQVPYLQVRYEDLLATPEITAKKIFDFLGVELHSNTLEFCRKITSNTSSAYHAKIQEQWYRNDHKVRVGRWRENLNEEEQEVINYLLTPLLTQFGYIDEQNYEKSKALVPDIGKGDNNEITDKRLIVVLGMHRSGTSTVTRGMQVLGVQLGDNFIPPQEDNVTGFWEDADLNEFNIKLLKHLHSEWYSLKPIESADVQNLRDHGYIQRALDILQRKMTQANVFGFKDPRVAKLLPFWKEVFAVAQWKVSYVIVIRHPLSVCKSLEKRHGFDFTMTSLLWLEHVISSLVNTIGTNRVLVDYDQVLQSPGETMSRIARALQMQINPAELKKFEDEFLNKELRHTIYQVDDLAKYDSIPVLVGEVYKDLLDVAEDKIELTDASLQAKIATWMNEFTGLKPILEFIDRLNTNPAKNSLVHDNQIMDLKAQVVAKDQELNAVYQSRSWKAARSLQAVMNIFRRMRSVFFRKTSQ